nr:MAG TPA: hypothetical protein [Caudoviricetes sp.]
MIFGTFAKKKAPEKSGVDADFSGTFIFLRV